FQLSTKSGEPLAGFEKLIVDLELSGMFDLAWKFKQISVSAPKINVTVASNGQLNWDALVAKLNEDKAPPSDTMPRLMIEHIIVSQGKVQYADANNGKPINTTVAPLGFQLKGFSTLPKDRGDYLISAAFAENGGSLKWKGDMGVNPVASKGVIALDEVKVAKILQLVKGLELPIQLNAGDAQASFNYDFSVLKTIPRLALNNITFSLSDVAAELTEGGALSLTHAVLSAPQLDFVGNKQSELHVKDLDFKLLGLNLKQSDQTQVTLTESTASLPQLDFSMQEQPQVVFNDLNLKFAGLNVKKGAQLSLHLPKADVNAVSLDLAQNNISFKDIVLSNIAFGKGSSGASVDGKPTAVKPIATLNQATLSDGLVAIADQKITAQTLLLSGFKTSVIKQADGSLNWVDMFASNGDPAIAEAIADTPNDSDKNTAATWAIALKKIALADANIQIKDDSTPTPVVMDIVKASIEVQDASLDMSKPLPIKAAFRVKQGGRFTTKGQLWPSPLKAKLGLRLSNLSLKPFAPYVNQLAFLKLKKGAANVSGQLNLKQKQDLSMAFNGKFGVKQLALLEEADDAPFLSWDDLSSDSLKVSLMPNKLHMGTLQVVKPAGKFIINEDKSMNVTRILRNQSTSAEPAPKPAIKAVVPQPPVSSDSLIQPTIAPQPPKAATKPVPAVAPAAVSGQASTKEVFPVSIDTVRVSDAKLEFADLSLTPQFGTNIHSLNGVINGLSTKAAQVSQVEMDGKVDEYGTARIRGSLQPSSATDFTDIKLAFTNLDMSRLTPYSGKFAGRRIDSGKLSVDLEYKVKDHQLAGENKFIINKIKLGERVDSADAADLPLDLAIAILEDSDGLIDLDLPISGSLDDPKFSYGSIVWKAIRNVLKKIVTAPFRALGKIFGGGAEDFDGIAFEAGVSTVSPPELEKLVKVSTALSKRLGLSLSIVPSYDVALDTQAIKEATYRKQVAKEMDVKLAEGQQPGPVDLGNENAQDAINTLHDKLTKKGLLKRMVSKFEKPEDGHFEKAQTSLIASIEVSEADLAKLAEARGKAIQEALLTNGVSEERLTIIKVVEAKAKDKNVKTELTLDVKKSPVATSAPTPGAQPVTQ
ncbi:MAG: DUF748 domain-containing protein, partial [Methylophilaceae bacterium]